MDWKKFALWALLIYIGMNLAGVLPIPTLGDMMGGGEA